MVNYYCIINFMEMRTVITITITIVSRTRLMSVANKHEQESRFGLLTSKVFTSVRDEDPLEDSSNGTHSIVQNCLNWIIILKLKEMNVIHIFFN